MEWRLEHALDLLGDIVSRDVCGLLVSDPAPGLSRLRVVCPGHTPDAETLSASMERLFSLLIEHPAAVSSRDRPSAPRELELPWRSYLAVPLIAHDTVIGVLLSARTEPDVYDAEDLALLSVVGSQLGSYLAGLHDWNALREQNVELERRQAQLAEAEARFRTSLETMLDCFGLFSAVRDANDRIVDFRVDYVNDAACRANGLTPEQQIGRSFSDVLPAQRTSLFEAYVHLVGTGESLGHAGLEYEEGNGQYGQRRVFDIRAARFGDGVIAVWRDVTASRQTQEALRDSEERFRATFEQAPVGIAHLDREGRWLRVNDRLCEILDFSREELLAGTFQEVTYLADVPIELAQMEEILRGGLRSFDMQKRYLRKTGEFVWCHLNLSPVRAADQTPKYFIAIVEDISARKEAEALLGAAAHEMRLPLSHIKGFVSSLRRTDLEWDAVTREDFLTEIETEADRLDGLIEDLLECTDFSAPAKRRVATSLNTLVVASLGRVRAELEGRSVQVDVPPALPQLELDVRTMERVLSNLLLNAHKYSPLESPIEVSACLVDDSLDLRVDDHGPGIPAPDRERIFEPFCRGASAAESHVPGKGLGLAICRSILAAHGGRIWVDDRPGGGARFAIRLPLNVAPE